MLTRELVNKYISTNRMKFKSGKPMNYKLLIETLIAVPAV
jgi:hypothetical protein